MTVSSLPIWVILSVVGMVALIVIAQINYYVPPMGKLRARCLVDKPAEQRNNSIIRLKRRIGEEYYPLIALVFYVVVSVCFCIENYKEMPGGPLVFTIILGVIIWLLVAIVAVSFLAGLMKTWQENAVQDLKEYYNKHYGVTVLYLDKIHEEYYDELSI